MHHMRGPCALSSSAAHRTACYPTWQEQALIVHRAHPSQQLRVRGQRETASHISGHVVESTRSRLEPAPTPGRAAQRGRTARCPFREDKHLL